MFTTLQICHHGILGDYLSLFCTCKCIVLNDQERNYLKINSKTKTPSTRSRVLWKTDTFSSEHGYRTKGQKRRFSNTMTSCLGFSSAHTIRKRFVWTQIFLNTKEKTFVFENTRLYVWMVKYDSKTLRVDADFFKKGGKNLRFRKYPSTCGRGSKPQYMQK